MRKFIVTSIAFLALIITPIYFYLKLANGYTDTFYLRFTSPKQSSFIIGNSRSAQGIVPSVINKQLGRNDVYNYSFTQTHSPYGPAYLRSIQQKIIDSTKHGIYIVTVDPWAVAGISDNAYDTSSFRELKLCVGNMQNVSSNPNISYLFKNFPAHFINLYTVSKYNKHLLLHSDGWLQVDVDMQPDTFAKRLNKKLEDYEKYKVPKFKFSKIRFNYLKQTINFLKKHGKVYLVRLPMHNKIFAIENKVMPNFNAQIFELMATTNVPYLDLTPNNSNYTYTDGNHLTQESSFKISNTICDWIKNIETK